MKAKEIMTGDYFRIAQTGKIIKIVAVDDNSGCVDYFDGDAGGMLTIGVEKIEPIPLTAEILEKNGFDKNNRHEYIYKDNYCKVCVSIGIRIQIDGIDLGEAPINVFIEGALFDINMNMSAIHKLQHALRLCGIDKEIVL